MDMKPKLFVNLRNFRLTSSATVREDIKYPLLFIDLNVYIRKLKC